ncbi:flagellar hook-length control protein FliK [Acetobacterium bakii]|nr:flagellar hook-length control protein FliK [Acetobacterium bakii]
MNAEFHAKMSSAINGMTVAAKPKGSSVALNGLKDEADRFKDMLNRSIKDPGQPARDKAALTDRPIKELSPDEQLAVQEKEEKTEDPLIDGELTALSPEMENPPTEINENDLKNLLQSNAMGFAMLRTNSEVNSSFDENAEAALESAGINPLENKLAETTESAPQMIQNPDTAQSQQMDKTPASIQGKSFNEIYSEENNANPENFLEQKNVKPADPSSAELSNMEESDQIDPRVGLEMGTSENIKGSEHIEKSSKIRPDLIDSKEIQNQLESPSSTIQVAEQASFGKTDSEQESIGIEDRNAVSSKEIQGIPFANMVSGKATEIQPNNPVALAGQLEQAILSQLDKNKPVKFMMSLEPGNLGKIDIELKFDQGKLTIDITALSKETQNLLSTQVDKLIKGLALQNVQVENVQLNSQSQERMNTDPKTLMMNMGMDFTQGQKQELLKENIMNQNNRAQNGSLENTGDLVGDNLEAAPITIDRSRRINYLV